MSKESAILIGRNAVIATVIALAFNPISMVIGYCVSQALSKPKIRVEFVTPVLEYEEVTLPWELVGELGKYEAVCRKLKQYYFFDGMKDVTNFAKLVGSMGTMMEGANPKVPYDFLEAATEYRAQMFSEWDVKIHVMRENLELLSDQEVFDDTLLRAADGVDMKPVKKAGGSGGPKGAHAEIEKIVARLTDEREGMEGIFAAIETLLDSEKQRSGEVTFEVGLLNEGDTDGVIYPEGELRVGEATYKTQTNPDTYAVIKPHSFKKMVFVIKKEEIPQKNLEHLSGLIRNHIPETYTLNVRTPRGDRSRREKLPVR